MLRVAGFDVQRTTDVTGVELAGAAKNAAVLAASDAAPAGAGAAGAAADMVFAEVDAYARRQGGQPETFAGLAGRDLVATVVARAAATGARRAARQLAPPRSPCGEARGSTRPRAGPSLADVVRAAASSAERWARRGDRSPPRRDAAETGLPE